MSKAIVEQVDREFPHLLRHNTHAACTEFLQRVIPKLPVGDQWGHVGKSAGEGGYTLPNSVRVSHDAIFSKSLHRQVDIVKAGGAHPAPGQPDWRVIDPSEYRPGNVWTPPQPFVVSGTPQTTTEMVSRLGFGWFCLMRALRDWPADAARDADWLDEHLTPDYYRVMLFVKGERHGRPDPWRDAGMGPDSGWQQTFKDAQAFLKARRQKLYATIFGDADFDLFRCCDLFLGAADWDVIEAVEVANEYNVNGFPPDVVRSVGRYLRARMPAHIGLALSSPHEAHNPTSDNNEAMEEGFTLLYGGDAGGADEISVHLARDGGKWSNPFNFNGFFPQMRKTNGEPIGVESSVAATSDPMALIADYLQTSKAGWTRYTGHASWCVFNGRIPSEYGGRDAVKHPWEHKNMEAICHGWKAVREGGSVDSGTGGGPSRPVGPGELRAGQSLLPEQTLVSPGGRARLHYQGDGNLVVYLDGAPFWASHTAGETAGSLQMQPDGNLVLQDAAQKALRATRTSGHHGAMVQLQDDGNFVIYDDPNGPQAGTPLWASATDELFA